MGHCLKGPPTTLTTLVLLILEVLMTVKLFKLTVFQMMAHKTMSYSAVGHTVSL